MPIISGNIQANEKQIGTVLSAYYKTPCLAEENV
jgi:hypothetical protein